MSEEPTDPTQPSGTVPLSRIVAFALVATILLTLAAFSPVLINGFITVDDPPYLTENPVVLRGLSVDGIVWAFTSLDLGNWHPLAWISHMAAVSLFGVAPTGHHATDLVIHILSGLLLFTFLRRTTGEDWPSLAVTAIFLLHPMRVESVAWVSERKDTLSVFFGLASLLAYERYVRTRSLSAFASTAIFFILSLMSKGTLVTLPFLLLLLDIWPLGRLRLEPNRVVPVDGERWGRILAEKTSLLPFSVACIILNSNAQATAKNIVPANLLPYGERIANAFIAYGAYIEKTACPVDLAFIYPHPSTIGLPFPWGSALLSALFLLIATAVFLRLGVRRPVIPVGWLWFIGTLLPMIGLVQTWILAYADRYTYFPSIGLLVAIVYGVGPNAYGERIRSAMKFLVPLVAITLAVLSFRQATIWSSTEKLFRHAAQVTERNGIVYDQLSRLVLADNKLDESLSWAEKVLEINPKAENALGLKGIILGRMGRNAEAAEVFLMFSERYPSDPMGPFYLGHAESMQGRKTEAIRWYREALRRDPAFTQATDALKELQGTVAPN